MGLRDQLLKAGLVSKKQAKKTEAEARKQDYDAKKNKVVAEKLATEKELELQQIEEERLRKLEHDKKLNLEREALRLEKEKYHRCMQLLASNRLNEPKANVIYFFPEAGKFVRKVMVTAYQREMLARGRFGIARPFEDSDDFYVVPQHTALTVKNLCPEKLLVLHPEVNDLSEVEAEE